MEAKDLMVGDWLKHANGKYYRVTRIDVLGDYNSIHYACGFPHLWEYNNKFEPIPLTPEILKTNGFEIYGEGEHLYSWTGYGANNDDDIEIDFDYEHNCIKTKIDVKGTYVSTDVIMYVHQLQHVFHVYRIDKEIIL